MIKTRFAPSPTGYLHLGHAYSAIFAKNLADQLGGRFLVRIEDIDQSRTMDAYEVQIFDDLKWLGIDFDQPVLRQSTRLDAYQHALSSLGALGLIYPCSCTRKDIEAALLAPQEGEKPQMIYPGTCRHRGFDSFKIGDAMRLNMSKALAQIDTKEGYQILEGKDERIVTLDKAGLLEFHGDIVLARKDIASSYHLSVVVDDAYQGITHVTRGEDLSMFCDIHVLLQRLLGLPSPIFAHHALIRDDKGKRLAKRDDARSIKSYKESGMRPEEVFSKVADQIIGFKISTSSLSRIAR